MKRTKELKGREQLSVGADLVDNSEAHRAEQQAEKQARDLKVKTPK